MHSGSKISQVAAVYGEQGTGDRTRKPHAYSNTSGLRSKNVSSSSNTSQANISRHGSVQSLKPLPTYTGGFSQNNSLLTNGECYNDMPKQQRSVNHRQSPFTIVVDKDMILGGYKPPGAGYPHKKSQEPNCQTLSASSAFNNLTKEFNKPDLANTSSGNGYLNLANSVPNGFFDVNGTNGSAWNSTIHFDAERAEAIENKTESLLSQKSIDTAHIEDIGSTLENVADVVAETMPKKEGQRSHHALRKIKLAYELFFQNYSHHYNIVQNKSGEQYRNLKRDHEVLEVKANAANSEVKSLRKENERLRQQLQHSGSISKNQQFDNEETPPNNKLYNQGFSQLHDAETLKVVIRDQQKVIQTLKKKEAKMIRLLYACKKKGLDIEQIYHENIKSSLEREEDDIPTLNKANKHQQSQNYLENDHKAAYQTYAFSGRGSDSECEHHSRLDDDTSYISNDLCPQTVDIEQAKNNTAKQPGTDQTKQHEKLESSLKNRLKLDFTQLRNPKDSVPQEKQMEFEIHQMPSVHSQDKSHYKHKKHLSMLHLGSLKEDEKSPGFHDEFMSRMDEFSISWRQAALKERKLPN